MKYKCPICYRSLNANLDCQRGCVFDKKYKRSMYESGVDWKARAQAAETKLKTWEQDDD